jgi:hypothetical protein
MHGRVQDSTSNIIQHIIVFLQQYIYYIKTAVKLQERPQKRSFLQQGPATY